MTTYTRPLYAAALLLVGSAQAYDSGDWLLRGGAHYVEPKSNNHGTVSVDGAASITASLSYFFTPNLAVDVLAAIPFEHDITLNGDGSTVASTMHLPPTVSMAPAQVSLSSGFPYLSFTASRPITSKAPSSLRKSSASGLPVDALTE